ncbi:peptidoglycan-binding protein [Streptomyces sp. AK02-04a]|uniref:peptidoglycan-binding protein n=1 Tax=Streptomyces sp. AK02-04a TaxID=3028649 RepID=UPI0029AA9255|nr:peptidoglycan-binding protein [Streptomyces sp. AK02-04a]MDX3759356.1 peptidoglycan-binding protein [Streptomyces sp. AK02-04a]
MALMPGATYIGPTPNKRVDGMVEVRGLVLHIQQGTEAGSESWFKNPASQASSHFTNPKTGGLRQLVDTKDRAWAEAAGNAHWVSVENEGFVPDALTASQVENAAQLLAWLHKTYQVPLQSTDDPNGKGLGWHGMGGAAWGGHTGCPGDAIKAQRPAIIARAKAILGIVPVKPSPKYEPFPGADWFSMGRKSPIVAAMHDRLVAVGCNHYQSSTNKDVIGSGDEASYEAWQRKCGYPGDWPPGKTTWDLLKVPNV